MKGLLKAGVLVTKGDTALLILSPELCTALNPIWPGWSWAEPCLSHLGRVGFPFLLPAPAAPPSPCQHPPLLLSRGNCFHLACAGSIPWKCGSLAAAHKALSGNSGDTWGWGGGPLGSELGDLPSSSCSVP